MVGDEVMPDSPDRTADVFNTARRLPAEGRAAYLDEACAGDAALSRRVEELLQASEEAGDFFESPAQIPAHASRRTHLRSPDSSVTVNLNDEAVGQTIGRYKLLEKVGEGGCGVVYVAQQNEPVRRRVALKVIK